MKKLTRMYVEFILRKKCYLGKEPYTKKKKSSITYHKNFFSMNEQLINVAFFFNLEYFFIYYNIERKEKLAKILIKKKLINFKEYKVSLLENRKCVSDYNKFFKRNKFQNVKIKVLRQTDFKVDNFESLNSKKYFTRINKNRKFSPQKINLKSNDNKFSIAYLYLG